MSPKQITRWGLIVGGVSIAGAAAMVIVQPGWGLMSWWPALGLGLALLLFVASFLKGAYLAAQRRVEMVDMLNDCYTGVAENDRAKVR